MVADDARELLERAGFRVRVTSNVYPAVDELDIVPARAVIHDAFEEHIIHAPGMERIGEVVSGRILPTPGAVLLAAGTQGKRKALPNARIMIHQPLAGAEGTA